MSIFRKAERKKAKLRLALDGCSGSGKTYSALLIAQGLGGKIAMADTEHGSGDLYAGLIAYDIVTFEPPYSPERYIKIIQEAEEAGYNVLIFDSLTHEWNGKGGILEIHDLAKKTSSNSFAAWAKVTPRHDALITAILQSNLHIICTIRTKTAYDLSEKDSRGKTKIQKIGTAPVQREGLDYEFTVVFDLIPDGHIATCSKDRTGLFDNTEFVPTSDTGRRLLKWLEGGSLGDNPFNQPEPPSEVSPPPRPDLQTVLGRLAGCKALPEVDNVEAKYVNGFSWNQQEWDVLKQAAGNVRTKIIKGLKDADAGKAPKQPDQGEDFSAVTKLHKKIHVFHKRVKELNPQYGNAWLSQLCKTYGGEGVNEPEDISTIARLEELLEAVEKKGKGLLVAQKQQEEA